MNFKPRKKRINPYKLAVLLPMLKAKYYENATGKLPYYF